MTVQTTSEIYERGLELAEAGKYQEGLNCVNAHLRTVPHDAQALNDAGTILHCLGRTQEAIAHLTRARSLKRDSAEIVWNLLEAYLAAGMAREAAELFDDMDRRGLLNIDVMNRTATLLLDQGRKGEALEVLLCSLRKWPQQEVLKPMIEVIRSKRPNVAFFGRPTGTDGALQNICEFAEQRFWTESYDRHRHDDVGSLMQWADIAWFDGGGDMVVEASRRNDPCKLVVSLRRSDVQGPWLRDLRWERVDMLVQIGSPAVEQALVTQVPDIRNRTRLVVVPNGVHLDRYTFHPRQRGKHLACMGHLTMEANPAFLLQCMQKLNYLDREYKLSFAGAFESPTLEQYTRHMAETLGLTSVVTFEPYPSDLSAWLADKHFVVSAGIGEDQVEALLVGMACGLKPIVHNFPGAGRLFPAEYLFNIAEQFCEHILAPVYEPAAYRRFVEDRFSIKEQLAMVNSVLTQLESEIELQSLTRPGVQPEGAARF